MLNQRQLEAVRDQSKSLLILAGPGTGKTRVLIEKILYEINQNKIDPERILALTFSRRATEEMQDRLAGNNPHLGEKVKIQTLHSMSMDVVTRHGFRLGMGKHPKLMSESQVRLMLMKLSDQLPLLHLLKTSSIDPLLDSILDFFSQSKDAGLWPEDILRYALSLPDSSPGEIDAKKEWMSLGEIYAVFQSKCFESGLIDFGDCLLASLRLTEEFHAVREELQSSYDLIFVDEFQDTNWTQIQFIKNIVRENSRIIVVGDDDQSIYRFRGASSSAFRFFEEAFPNSNVVKLTETYRLPVPVAQAATQLIRCNLSRYDASKSIESKSTIQGTVRWVRTTSENHEAKKLSLQIQELRKNNPQESIAVIVRSHNHALSLSAELKSLQLSVYESSERKILEHPAAQDCLALLRLLHDPQDNVSFYRLLDSGFVRLKADDIYSLSSVISKNGYTQIKKSYDRLTLINPESLKKWIDLLDRLTLMALKSSASDVLLAAFEETGSISFWLETDPDSLASVGRFFELIKSLEQDIPQNELRSTFHRIESLIQQSNIERDPPTDFDVCILTCHGSKGLEFDHVFIPSMVSRRIPSVFKKDLWALPQSLTKEEPLNSANFVEEERRLLYVAMTRAKRSLTLSSFEKKGTKASVFLLQDLKSLNEQGIIEEINYLNEEFSSTLTALTQPFSRIAPPKNRAAINSKPLSLSFTQLEKYETCPLSYQFKYVFQVPVRTPIQMSLGSVIHSSLEMFFEKVKSGTPPEKNLLLEEFEKYFLKESENTSLLTETHKALGIEKLSQYYDHFNGRFPIPFALEKDFILPVHEHKIRGKIDRVDKTDNGFRIVDYKTGKSKSNSNPEDQKFAAESLQFSIYALAARDVFQWKIEELVFDYIYDCSKLSTTRTDEQLDLVKQNILQIAKQIQSQEFPPKPGFHCQWCEYRDICPAATK